MIHTLKEFINEQTTDTENNDTSNKTMFLFSLIKEKIIVSPATAYVGFLVGRVSGLQKFNDYQGLA